MKRLTLLALIICAACATNRLEKRLASWTGHDVNELIVEWGPPSSTFDMPDGRKMYTWFYNGGAVAVPIGQTAVAVPRNCTITFTTSTSGRVEGWRYQGNAC